MRGMTVTTSAAVLDRATVVHLRSDGGLATLAVDEASWAHRATQPELGDGRILAVFGYDATWTWWERHPVGDELAYVLEGRVRFCLEDADGCRRVDVRRGECGLIPAGAWHRAEVEVPCRVLFVTPTPARTEHRTA